MSTGNAFYRSTLNTSGPVFISHRKPTMFNLRTFTNLPCFRISLFVLVMAARMTAQQTLGSLQGIATDPDGRTIANVSVKVIAADTELTRAVLSKTDGSYSFVNLPIGAYTVIFARDGFSTTRFPNIHVQADRTFTLSAQLAVTAVSTSITVEANPLLNATDVTNGYVIDESQIRSIPLSTGSFTGLAILSAGVNAELPGGTGVNSGLGNLPIWANGQRDTSNSFLLNGVDSSNLFNGKTTSQVASARVVNNTGVGSAGVGGLEQSEASVYLAIGNAIPTPPPDTVQELHVNTSMYGAEQGSNSGAHVDLSTKSGSNSLHGTLYGNRESNWLNAVPFFFKKDSGIPAGNRNPGIHRYTAGGTVGGPLLRRKLFFFAGYEHLHISDEETGDTEIATLPGLTSNNRTPAGLAQLVSNKWASSLAENGLSATSADWSSNPVALSLFQAKMADGQYVIPNDNGHTPDFYSPSNAFEKGTSYFIADRAVVNLDYNPAAKDQIALKYFYQHDPNSAPYALSSVPGFTEHMDAGAQVFSLIHTQFLRPNLSLAETLGFIREKAYSTNDQLWTPGQVGSPVAAMSTAFGTYFPGFTIVDALGADTPAGLGTQSINIGPSAASQSAYTGVFQNRLNPSVTAILSLGKHTLTAGNSFAHTQLNVRDLRTGKGTVATPDFVTFSKDWVTPYSTNGFVATNFLQGDANRYYRANQDGLYLQDKFQIEPNLSVTVGVRYDWNGGLTEKHGRIFNFDPTLYQYSAGSDTILNSGLIIAGNNVHGTTGVSETTLNGRQWGVAPRIGVAWSPLRLDSKLVLRSGFGMYYDRGELYTYLSPGYAAGEVSGGPFGVSQSQPFVTQQHCPYSASPYGNTSFLYDYYIPICDTSSGSYTLQTPWGTTRSTPPGNASATELAKYLPNAAGIIAGEQPYTLGAYNPANKLPYSINFTLDAQWQPGRNLLVDLGYVGNLGRHQVIPLPINQARIATLSSPALAGGAYAQSFSYGYTVLDPNTFAPICLNDPSGNTCSFGRMQQNYEGGNVDLRVPYIGYSSESESYTAAGVSAHHALQLHIEKRLSHGFQSGISYTFSHTTDEQSALGLFYNGNNPDRLRSGYGSADFDRTHVLNFTFSYALPKLLSDRSVAGALVNRWSISGLGIVQSGQPYSVIDYSGAVASIFYSTFDGITNPIVPLAPGCSAKSAVTGQSGAFYDPATGSGAALKSSCFTIPLIAPGTMGVPQGDNFETNFTTGQRNIFRQSWQRRLDLSLAKEARIFDRYAVRYTIDAYNATNTASFDIPSDYVSQNAQYNNAPVYDPDPYSLYTKAPGGLGVTKHTIGSPRQIQMSLHLIF